MYGEEEGMLRLADKGCAVTPHEDIGVWNIPDQVGSSWLRAALPYLFHATLH